MHLLLPWVFFLRAVGALAFLGFTFLITITLSQYEVGLYFFGTAIVVIISTIGRCGTDSVLVADISSRNKTNDHLDNGLSKYLVVVFFVSSLLVIIAYIALLALVSVETFVSKIEVLRILILAILPMSLSITYAEYFKAKQKPILSITFRFILIPMCLIVFGLGGDLLTNIYDLSRLYVCVICVVCLLAMSIASTNFDVDTFNYDQLISVVSTSMPLLFVALCGLLVGWLDVAALGLWYGPEVVANYGVATKISTIFTFVGTSVLAIYSPIISQKVDDAAWEKLSNMLKKIMFCSLSIGILLFGFVMFFGVKLLAFLGGEYTKAYNILLILCAAQCINIVFGPVGFLMIKFGLGRSYAKTYGAIVGMFVPLYAVFIPIYGALAAALMALVMFTAINLVCSYHIRKKTKIRYF